MPKSIKLGISLVVVSLLIGGVDLLLQTVQVTTQDTPTGGFTGFIVGVLITGVFLVFIAKRHNWARWVFIILTSLTVLLVIPIFLKETGSDPIGSISTLIQVTLQAAAVILLLQRSAGQWFRKENDHGGQHA